MQVAAPPKGSISVGWLWVSFLNMQQPVLLLPVHRGGDVDGTGVDLLATGPGSGSKPRFFSTLAPMVAMSISVWGRAAAFSGPYTSARAAR